MSYRCLLFDLDGTLVDSRTDLVNSINLMLCELDRDQLSDSIVLKFVGEGARLLVERALNATQVFTPHAAEIDCAMEIFFRHYRTHLFDYTRPYPEVVETLEALQSVPKAIVTNKPYEFTVKLLEGTGLSRHFKAILGGDSLPERKPSPMMLLEAARQCHVEIQECLMIGDSRVDIEAGKAAGIRTCGYIPGFRGRTELAQAGADYLIERFSELRYLL